LAQAAARRSAISPGVPAGAKAANHCVMAISGKPASAIVGMSGSIAERSFDVTASRLSRPDCAQGMTGPAPSTPTGTTPPGTSCTAWPPPL